MNLIFSGIYIIIKTRPIAKKSFTSMVSENLFSPENGRLKVNVGWFLALAQIWQTLGDKAVW